MKLNTNSNKSKEEKNKMASLKETAQDYSSTAILNIADLELVPIDLEVKEETDRRDCPPSPQPKTRRKTR